MSKSASGATAKNKEKGKRNMNKTEHPNCDLLNQKIETRDIIINFLESLSEEKKAFIGIYDNRHHLFINNMYAAGFDPTGKVKTEESTIVPECYGEPGCPSEGAEGHHPRRIDRIVPINESLESLSHQYLGICLLYTSPSPRD